MANSSGGGPRRTSRWETFCSACSPGDRGRQYRVRGAVRARLLGEPGAPASWEGRLRATPLTVDTSDTVLVDGTNSRGWTTGGLEAGASDERPACLRAGRPTPSGRLPDARQPPQQLREDDGDAHRLE